jgi:hypothetical protein
MGKEDRSRWPSSFTHLAPRWAGRPRQPGSAAGPDLAFPFSPAIDRTISLDSEQVDAVREHRLTCMVAQRKACRSYAGVQDRVSQTKTAQEWQH